MSTITVEAQEVQGSMVYFPDLDKVLWVNLSRESFNPDNTLGDPKDGVPDLRPIFVAECDFMTQVIEFDRDALRQAAADEVVARTRANNQRLLTQAQAAAASLLALPNEGEQP